MSAADPVDSQNWRFFTDQVMGGVSTGEARLSGGVLSLQGDVSTANNGGFIQARAETGPFDAQTTGLRIRVKGDGQRYFIHLRTKGTRLPWQYYQATFETSEDWQTIALPWSAFEASGALLRNTPNPENIKSVALVAYGRDHNADVSLAEFSGY